MKLFTPKQSAFFPIFKAITGDIKEIVSLFNDLAKNFNNFEHYYHRGQELERAGDTKTHEVIDKLNKTFITPFDREDIYLLAHELDDIIDLVEKVIHDIYLYRITEKYPIIDKFAPLIVSGADYTEKLMDCFEKQKYTTELNDVKIAIHKLEDEGDEIFNAEISRLFTEEKDPIKVIKYRDVLRALEGIMDKYQKVSNIVESIIVKST